LNKKLKEVQLQKDSNEKEIRMLRERQRDEVNRINQTW